MNGVISKDDAMLLRQPTASNRGNVCETQRDHWFLPISGPDLIPSGTGCVSTQ